MASTRRSIQRPDSSTFPEGPRSSRFGLTVERSSTGVASIVRVQDRAENPGAIRNALALTCSPDLAQWEVRCVLLCHPDVSRHGFQYVDWLFQGEDIIAACRTAFDDDQGAHNDHDANDLTFHRVAGFRRLTLADSADRGMPR